MWFIWPYTLQRHVNIPTLLQAYLFMGLKPTHSTNQEHISTEPLPEFHTSHLFHNPLLHLHTLLEEAGTCTLFREPLSTLVPRNYKGSGSWKRKTDTVTVTVHWRAIGILALGKDLCGRKQLTWNTQQEPRGLEREESRGLRHCLCSLCFNWAGRRCLLGPPHLIEL